ncbi:MAG TPA: peroxiredoxin [bacterium]|nr:peroxiredoxin [bacterium]
MNSLLLREGEPAPDFELPAPGNRKIRLSQFRGEKNVVIGFHPLAWTPVCALQMKGLEENSSAFKASDTVALGISVDAVPSKTAWAESLGIKEVLLLSDFEPKGEVARLYGVYRDSGFSERAVFLVDKEGIIRFARVYPIKEVPDLSPVLALLKETGE